MINIKKILAPRKSGGGTTIVNGGGKQSTSITSQYVSSAQIDTLLGNDLNYQKGTFVDLTASNGIIENLSGTNLEYENGRIDNLESDVINAGDITADSITATKGSIDSLESKNIITEYLTVTKQAHFFELIIDKIRSVGGSVILSATNCVLDYAEPIYNSNNDIIAYDVYWQATDNKGKAIVNEWEQNDQAICQNFNDAREGTSQYVSNKYYWRLVTQIKSDVYMWLGSENDPRNGMIVQASESSINKVNLNIWNWIDGQPVTDGIPNSTAARWTVTAQSTAGWSASTTEYNFETRGTFISTNTTNGIVLTPNSYIENKILDHISIAVTALPISTGNQIGARLNVTFELNDGTSLYYPAGNNLATSYDFYPSAVTNTPISRIIITNADEVMYKKVHCIRLGNVSRPQYPDTNEVDGTSIPGPGDNLVQLGYRYQLPNSQYGETRASAIIISAYHTPDTGITPPSYAQYMLINTFDLPSKRHTYFDATQAHFEGDFYVDANNTIQMNVYDTINNRTGIDIEQGTITLDAANTYINGNLTLTSNDQGFLVRGPQGMAIMTPNTIGSLYDFLGETNNIAEVGGHDVKTPNSSSDTTFEQFYILGNLEANKSITISDFESEFVWNDTLASAQMLGSTSTVTFQLKKGNTIIDSDDITGLGQGGTICTLNTGANSGTFTLNVQISTRPATHRNAQMTANWKYYVTIPISGTYTKIGTDGIAIKFDNNKYAYFGNDETQIVYEANGTRSGISVTAAGHVQQLAPDGQTWVPIGIPKVTEITTTGQQYTANYRGDEFYIATGNFGNTDVVINLPISGIPEGKKVYVKNAQNGSATLNCTSVSGSSGRIIKSDKNLGNGITQMVEVDAYPRMFIYTGTYWCEFYCG